MAKFINDNFEPAWEMVRPVPLVRIDFGNGTVLTRTLHGNIATYVCTADGLALDILPGIYEPRTYLHCLDQFRLLANFVDRFGPEQRTARFLEYHRAWAKALANREAPPQLVNTAGISKAAIERGVLAVLVSGKQAANQYPRQAKTGTSEEVPNLNVPGELANWNLLAEDTRVNETIRRKQVHDMLAGVGMVRPDALKKRLYKEVLRADLDDPYLGLGEELSGQGLPKS